MATQKCKILNFLSVTGLDRDLNRDWPKLQSNPVTDNKIGIFWNFAFWYWRIQDKKFQEL